MKPPSPPLSLSRARCASVLPLLPPTALPPPTALLDCTPHAPYLHFEVAAREHPVLLLDAQRVLLVRVELHAHHGLAVAQRVVGRAEHARARAEAQRRLQVPRRARRTRVGRGRRGAAAEERAQPPERAPVAPAAWIGWEGGGIYMVRYISCRRFIMRCRNTRGHGYGGHDGQPICKARFNMSHTYTSEAVRASYSMDRRSLMVAERPTMLRCSTT